MNEILNVKVVTFPSSEMFHNLSCPLIRENNPCGFRHTADEYPTECISKIGVILTSGIWPSDVPRPLLEASRSPFTKCP